MKYVNLHTHSNVDIDPDGTPVYAVVNQYPDKFDDKIAQYSIGIHPWYIDENRLTADLQTIESKLESEKCLAVGECGLDKRIEVPYELQVKVFELQLTLAQKYKKPVIVHCVAAFSEVIQIKKKMQIAVPMIIHGFSKNEQTAQQLLDNGFYLSFGKYLLRNPELESVFKNIPNDKFFLETDTIQDSSVSEQAKQTIGNVYALAAKYKNVSLQQLSEQMDTNFATVFQPIKHPRPSAEQNEVK